MLSDDKIRELLLKAGATVPIGASGPIEPQPPSRRWIPVAAVVAVAATVAAIFAATDGSDGDSEPAPTPPTWPSEIPNAYQLEPDQVPLLFGYSVEQATAVLEDQGFAVEHRLEESCDVPDRVTTTSPDVGTRLEPGAVVTIVTAKRETPGVCGFGVEQRAAEEMAWSLLDFATGRGGPPQFADEVEYFLGDFEHLTLTKEEAEDPASWDRCPPGLPTQCPVSPWRELLQRQYWVVNGQPVTPHFDLHSAPASVGCFGAKPLPFGGNALLVKLTIPMDGIFCQPEVQVLTNRDGSIHAVVLSSAFEASDFPYGVDVLSVIGMGEAGARLRLEEQGLQVDAIRPPGTKQCIAGTYPIVASQDPAAGERIVAGSTVTLTLRWVLCGEVAAEDVAREFVSFARGDGNPPQWADHVDLYLGNSLIETIQGVDAAQPAAWRLCPDSGYAGVSCPFSALDVLRRADGPVVYTTTHADPGACAEEFAEPPMIDRFVTIGLAEPRTCIGNFAIELYLDADSRITGVNLVLGSP